MAEKKMLVSWLMSAENMGDVNDCIPGICEYLDLPDPVWSDSYERFYWPDEVPQEEVDV